MLAIASLICRETFLLVEKGTKTARAVESYYIIANGSKMMDVE